MTKTEAEYQSRSLGIPPGEPQCAKCKMFWEQYCDLLEGFVSPHGCCKYFKRKPEKWPLTGGTRTVTR